MDFSFENGTKYKLPEGLGDGPQSEPKKQKKMNSQINITNGATIEYYSRSPAKMSSSKSKAIWKPPVGRNGMSSSLLYSSTQVTVQSRNKVKIGSAERKSTTSSQSRAKSLTELHRATAEIRKKLEDRSLERRTLEIIKDMSPVNQKLHF